MKKWLIMLNIHIEMVAFQMTEKLICKNLNYMLAAQFTAESKQLQAQSNVDLCQTHNRQFRNASVAARNLKDHDRLNQLVHTNEACRLVKHKGIPAMMYWQ